MSKRQPSAPPQLPGFEYVELLGMGGFADVFKYEQLGLRRPVGVKVLFRGLGDSGQASFEAEAKLMAQLSNHPSIVSIYAAGAAEDGRPYLVMEYCPPPGLDKRIRHRPMAVNKALEIVIQISGAVETAHRLGILHRDVKPANILFTEFGRPALTDFGISVSTAPGIGAAEGVGVSVPWAPPEQLVDGTATGPEADVYSLSATLWNMLAGRSPFELPSGPNDPWEVSKRIRSDSVPRVGRADVPESLERVLRTAMAKEPAQRYSTALEFARALQTVQTELHLPTTSIEIRDDRIQDGSVEEDADGGTRIAGYIAIDPEGMRSGTDASGWGVTTPGLGATRGRSGTTGALPQPRVLQHGRGIAEPVQPVEFTTPTAPSGQRSAPAELAAPVADPATPRSHRNLLMVAVVALVLVLGGGAYLKFGGDPKGTSGGPTGPSASAAPADPLGSVVPVPTKLAVSEDGSRVTFSWTDPQPQAGDSYLYQVVNPQSPQPVQTATATTVTVAAQPGQTCLQVRLLRTSGQASDWSKAVCTALR